MFNKFTDPQVFEEDDVSSAQQRFLARRAAMVNGYRNAAGLAGKSGSASISGTQAQQVQNTVNKSFMSNQPSHSVSKPPTVSTTPKPKLTYTSTADTKPWAAAAPKPAPSAPSTSATNSTPQTSPKPAPAPSQPAPKPATPSPAPQPGQNLTKTSNEAQPQKPVLIGGSTPAERLRNRVLNNQRRYQGFMAGDKNAYGSKEKPIDGRYYYQPPTDIARKMPSPAANMGKIDRSKGSGLQSSFLKRIAQGEKASAVFGSMQNKTPLGPQPKPAAAPAASTAPAPATASAPKPQLFSPLPGETSSEGQGKHGLKHEDIDFSNTPSNIKSIYEQVVFNCMDMGDYETVQGLSNLDEAEQNTLLLSLTNKLYKMIVGKIEDIDFGDIPNTKGNIYKLPKYKQLRDCVEVMHDIFVQYKEDTAPIDEIDHAISNLENNRDLFIASFAGKIEVGQMIYNTVALGIVQSISFMIAVTIEYVKDPKAKGLKIVVDKTGMAKVKDHLVYQSICKFNEACQRGEIEKVLRQLIKKRVKNFLGVGELIGLTVLVITVAIFASAIIGWLRDLVYFFYAARVRASSYFDLQANLLEMNAKDLKEGDYETVGDKDKVIRRQLAIARMFTKLADKIAIEGKESEIKASKDIKSDKAEYKLDDVNTNPAVGDEPLF